MHSDVARQIVADERFWSDVDHLEGEHHRRRLLAAENTLVDESILARLSESAAILALAKEDNTKYISYRIATLLSQLQETAEWNGCRSAAKLALARLGHFPAVAFLERQLGQQPLSQLLEWECASRRASHEVFTGTGRYVLTDFQLDLWHRLVEGISVSAAAPTSAGKSFLLKLFLGHLLATRDELSIAIVVPTRALISQTARDIAASLTPDLRAEVTIRIAPLDANQTPKDRVVLVYTQERLSIHLAAHPEDRFDALIIDEAQMLAEMKRGVLLASVIRECVHRNPDTQLFYAMPNISNPEIANAISGTERFSAVHTALPAVTQNIFAVEQRKGHPRIWDLALRDDHGNFDPIGSIEIEGAQKKKADRLATAVANFGQSGANLVYADGPDAAEKTARAITLARKARSGENNARRSELREFVSDAIHPGYCLVEFISHGVGLHYGHIPTQVRQNIEIAFSAGVLDTIVTTSTLLYGVNLPAKNLFLLNPRRGNLGALPTGDFWNLAGRAGRLGEEFEGNVFLVDYKDWELKPLDAAKEYELQPTVLRLLLNEPDKVRDFIVTQGSGIEPRDKDRLALESLTVQLEQACRRHTLESEIARLGVGLDTPIIRAIIGSIENAASAIDLDPETLKLSPTIPSWIQDNLFKHFRAEIRAGRQVQLILQSPNRSTAYSVLLDALQLMINKVEGAENSSHEYLTLMADWWMKGKSLQAIVDRQHKYRVKNKEVKAHEIDKTIRKVLREIEEDLRFRCVRLMGCYMAVLRAAFVAEGLEAPAMPPIPIFLELGLSQPAELDLASIGLSRYAVRKLSTFFKNDGGEQPAIEWLRSVDLADLNVSDFVRFEVEQFI